jgi:hypothetical protein
VVGDNGPDGGTGIYANFTNPPEGSYGQISTQGLARIASLIVCVCLPYPRPASLARMMACARSATWSLLKMLET